MKEITKVFIIYTLRDSKIVSTANNGAIFQQYKSPNLGSVMSVEYHSSVKLSANCIVNCFTYENVLFSAATIAFISSANTFKWFIKS